MQETYERLTLMITTFDQEDVIVTSGTIEDKIPVVIDDGEIVEL